MALKTITLALSLLSTTLCARAAPADYAVQLQASSYPTSAGVQADAGYGLPLWGDVTKDGFLYGYIRPGFSLVSAAVVNRFDAYIDIYPITLLGFRLGHAKSLRFTDFSEIDCLTVECRGAIDSNYVEAKLQFGYGPVFVVGQLRAASWTASRAGKPFLEDDSYLPGRAGSDTALTQGATLGAKMSSSYSTGVYFTSNRFVYRSSNNSHASLFFQKELNDFRFVVGAGRYQSTIQNVGITSYLAIQWTGAPAIGLQ